MKFCVFCHSLLSLLVWQDIWPTFIQLGLDLLFETPSQHLGLIIRCAIWAFFAALCLKISGGWGSLVRLKLLDAFGGENGSFITFVWLGRG